MTLKKNLTFSVLVIFILSVNVIPLYAQGMEQPSIDDLFAMSLDDLLNMEVTTITKQATKLSDAPASMTVITADDIKKYGYQTLPEALARVAEVHTHFYGHNNEVDFRGFFSNNTSRRTLYLLNGHKLNDRFHFGDFEADLISDLSNVERIEVIRGPGAALYGNNSVTGVVNIITKGADKEGQRLSAAMTSNFETGSFIQKYNYTLRKKVNDDTKLVLDLDWLKGKLKYDTKTTWDSAYASKSGWADYYVSTDAYFDTDKSDSDNARHRGQELPNLNFRLDYKDVAVGAFLYSKAVSWVWPKDSATFNSNQNDRGWGTSGIYVEYNPSTGLLGDLQVKTKLSYNVNTNREVAFHSSADSQSRYLGSGIYRDGWAVYIKDDTGAFVRVNDTLDAATLFSVANLDANGGGANFVYHGTDKVTALDFQLTPYDNEDKNINLMVGGNYEMADYSNYQRFTYANNKFIGWAKWGGITDKGFTTGLWSQLIYSPTDKITFTGGLRLDYQKVKEVYRQLGGKLRYSSPQEGSQILAENKIAKDLTPRLALNYRINEDSNIRLIYAQAFRAVSAQEINRLSDPTIEAESEKTENFEVIYSTKINKNFSVTGNIFYLEGSELYSWVPAINGFSNGSGWKNTGISLETRYTKKQLDIWQNLTWYDLKRATDAQSFMSGPNLWKPLDSPTFMFKCGGSFNFSSLTTLALELFYNGKIKQIHPAETATEAYHEHEIKGSYYLNLILTQDFENFGWEGWHGLLKIENVFDNDVWGTFPRDAESSLGSYQMPHQIRGIGRKVTLQVSKDF